LVKGTMFLPITLKPIPLPRITCTMISLFLEIKMIKGDAIG